MKLTTKAEDTYRISIKEIVNNLLRYITSSASNADSFTGKANKDLKLNFVVLKLLESAMTCAPEFDISKFGMTIDNDNPGPYSLAYLLETFITQHHPNDAVVCEILSIVVGAPIGETNPAHEIRIYGWDDMACVNHMEELLNITGMYKIYN